jgi:cytochrome oxidase assembly protein ShyY1
MELAKIRFYISQLNWLVVIFTLLVFSGLIKLGFWQSSRALEKEQRIERISVYNNQESLSLQKLLTLQNNNENINDIPVRLAGVFDNQKVFLLDNQTHKGRLGYRVLQVLKLEQGNVLVNLGWVEGFIDRSKLPTVEAITGEHEITGNVRIIEKGLMLTEQQFTELSWPLRVQAIEIDKFSTLISQKLLPFVVYLDKKETLGFAKNWRPIVMPPEKHRAYAFQWFSLALAWIMLMLSASVWFAKNTIKINIKNNKNNKKV